MDGLPAQDLLREIPGYRTDIRMQGLQMRMVSPDSDPAYWELQSATVSELFPRCGF